MVRPPESESMPTDSLINRALGILRFYSIGICSRSRSRSVAATYNHRTLHSHLDGDPAKHAGAGGIQ
jgi:hypothetical protein